MKSFGLFIVSVLLAGHAFAADATGTYSGSFDGRKGTVTLAQNANGYSLTFQSVDGSADLIGEGCQSMIGAAKKVKEKNGTLSSLVFEFTPGVCFQVEGRELNVKVKGNQLSLSLYARTETMENCNFDANGRQYCNDVNFPVYADGKFKR